MTVYDSFNFELKEVSPPDNYQVLMSTDINLGDFIDNLLDNPVVNKMILDRLDPYEVLDSKKFRDIREKMDDFITENYSEDDILDLFDNIVENNLSDDLVRDYICDNYLRTGNNNQRFVDFMMDIYDDLYDLIKLLIEYDSESINFIVDIIENDETLLNTVKEKLSHKLKDNTKNENNDNIRINMLSKADEIFNNMNLNFIKSKESIIQMIFENTK